MRPAVVEDKAKAAGRAHIRGRKRRKFYSAALGLLAWVVGLIFFMPIFWMVLTGLHSQADLPLNPPRLFAPLTREWFVGFFGATSGGNPMPYLINSAQASILSTVLVLALSIPAAYALSVRPVKKWSEVLFFFLGTKMLPLVAGLTPIFLIANALSMLNNIWFLTVIYTGMNLPIAVWMIRAFMSDIPKELFEAASLDGAGLIRTLWSIVGPVLAPGIAATSLICFIFSWNELLFASALGGANSATAPVYLLSFVTSVGSFLPQLCAAATIVSVPVLAAGFAAQDRLVQGLSLGAIK